MAYNPNSIWTSKKEPFKYEPTDGAIQPLKKPDPPAQKTPPPTERPQPVDEPSSPGSAKLWLWVGILLVVLIAAGAGFYLFAWSPAPKVAVAVSADQTSILSGAPFSISVSLTNDSGETLKGASIQLLLPNNVSSIDSQNQRVVVQPVGDVSAGGVSHQTFNLIATGVSNVVEHFTAKVTYASSGSSAQFESDGSADVLVGDYAIGLNISPPQNVFSGQNFTLAVNYNNNTDQPAQNVSLVMQYPQAGFTMMGAQPAPDTPGGATWTVGTIPADASGTISIVGNLEGSNGSSYPIGATLNENISGQTFAIAQQTENTLLTASPLSFSIAVNNTPDYVSGAGDSLDYVLTYTNTSNVTFQNAAVTASLVGSMFNFSSLQTVGSFNSITNTVGWNGANSPQLLSIAPGQSGSVEFHIQTKQSFPIRLLSDKNYSLAVNGKIFSPTVPPGTTASSTTSVAEAITKLRGNIMFAETGYYHDPTAKITNTGPYPPKVNQPTQYTIHWIITNYSTDADDVMVSAYLQSGTTCTTELETNGTTAPICNPSNGEVTWQIPVIPATTGIADAPLEAVFQVQNTPAVNQVGQAVTLIGPATLTATDAFTSSTMQSAAQALTTALPNDTSVPAANRAVGQ